MTSPFLDKSPTELLAMLPGLSDPELDALCAAVCDGEWVREGECAVDGLYLEAWDEWLPGPQWDIYPEYTSDPREAMRLLVKYRISLVPQEVWWCRSGIEHTPIHQNANPCRAIAMAAVTIELTRAIEGDGE